MHGAGSRTYPAYVKSRQRSPQPGSARGHPAQKRALSPGARAGAPRTQTDGRLWARPPGAATAPGDSQAETTVAGRLIASVLQICNGTLRYGRLHFMLPKVTWSPLTTVDRSLPEPTGDKLQLGGYPSSFPPLPSQRVSLLLFLSGLKGSRYRFDANAGTAPAPNARGQTGKRRLLRIASLTKAPLPGAIPPMRIPSRRFDGCAIPELRTNQD